MQRAWLVVGLLTALGGDGLLAAAAPDPWAEAETRVQTAVMAKRVGRYDIAVNECQAALKIDPQYHEARWVLGWVLAEQGRKPEAAEQFRTIVALVPGTTKAKEALAGLERLGEPLVKPPARPGAPKPTKVVKYTPADQPSWRDARTVVASADQARRCYEQGLRLKREIGDYDRATEAFNRALRFNPDYLDAHWALAWVYAEKGLKADAAEHFRQILRLIPGTVQSQEAAAGLQRMGESPFPARPDLAGAEIKALTVRSHQVVTGAANPHWGADGNQVVFTRMGVGLSVCDADGGNPRLVVKGLKPVGVAADGKSAYAVDLVAPESKLSLVNLIDGTVQPFAPAFNGRVDELVVAPGGKTLLIIARHGSSEEPPLLYELTFISADGTQVKALPKASLSCPPQWSADGARIAWTAENKVIVANAAGDGKAVADGGWAAWVGPTDRLLVRTPEGDLVTCAADGSGRAMLHETVKELRVDRAWSSPTGKWVLFRENGRTYGFVNVADPTRKLVLGLPTKPIVEAFWLPKTDILCVCDRLTAPGSVEPVWELIDPDKPATYHPVLRDVFIWGRLNLSPDGRMAAYWQASPEGFTISKSFSRRNKFAGRIVVGSTDSSVKLPWTIVAPKTAGSSAGMAWAPKGDAIAYWVPASSSIGVVALGKK